MDPLPAANVHHRPPTLPPRHPPRPYPPARLPPDESGSFASTDGGSLASAGGTPSGGPQALASPGGSFTGGAPRARYRRLLPEEDPDASVPTYNIVVMEVRSLGGSPFFKTVVQAEHCAAASLKLATL